LKKSQQGWRFLLNNWFIIPMSIPIIVFVLPDSI
jgi:hypothetical protein